MDYKYYLFDLDGTLTDPGIGITNSVMYALEKFGIHVSDRTELYPFIGPPLTDSFKKYFGFDEQQALLAVDYYREYFRAGGIFENAVYEGIPEMLCELKKRNATDWIILICISISIMWERPRWTEKSAEKLMLSDIFSGSLEKLTNHPF